MRKLTVNGVEYIDRSRIKGRKLYTAENQTFVSDPKKAIKLGLLSIEDGKIKVSVVNYVEFEGAIDPFDIEVVDVKYYTAKELDGKLFGGCKNQLIALGILEKDGLHGEDRNFKTKYKRTSYLPSFECDLSY